MRPLVVVTLLAAVVAAEPARADVMHVTVIPFTGEGIKEDVVSGLQVLFVDELRKLGDELDVPDVNARALQVIGECAGDTTCLGKKLARLGTTHFITGVVTRPQGGGYQLDLDFFATPAGEQLNTHTQLIKGKGNALETQAARAAVSLVFPERMVGTLVVDVDVSGAEVWVDGRRVGKSPLAGPVGNLREGTRKVKVTREGYKTFEAEVPIVFREEAGLDVRLVRVDVPVARSGDDSQPFAPRTGPGRGPPTGAIVAAPVGGGLTLVGTVLMLVVTGAAAATTFYMARVLETRAASGQLLFPEDQSLLWGWRISFGTMIAAAVGVLAVAAVGIGVTAAVAGGLLAFHMTRPLPEPAEEEFGLTRARERRAKSSRVVDDGGESGTPDPGGEEATKPAGEETPAPAAKEAPRARKKSARPAEMTEENLPEGE